MTSIIRRIPQGSILCLFLLNVFVSDISVVVKSSNICKTYGLNKAYGLNKKTHT